MIFFIPILLATLSCTINTAHHTQNGQLDALSPFHQAHHSFVAAQEEPDVQKRMKLFEKSQLLLQKSEQSSQTPEEQSTINFNKGIIWLTLARTTQGIKKQRACTQAAKTTFEQSNNPMAWYNLGCMYHLGAPGLQTDPIKAFECYTHAVQAGLPQALTNLQQLQKRMSKKLDNKSLPEFPMETLTRACTSPIRKFNIALQAFKDDIPEAALQILESISTPDSTMASLALFERGRYAYAQKKFDLAADLLKQAARSAPPIFDQKKFKKELFNTVFQFTNDWYDHATQYVSNEKLSIDKNIHKKIKELLLIAVQEQFPQAHYLLGLSYRIKLRAPDLNTKEMKKYENKAIKHFKTAACSNYVPAMRQYALAMQSNKNIPQAIFWLEKAATDHKNIEAQRMLAELYIIQRDETAVKKWYNIAAENGCVISRANLLNLTSKVKNTSIPQAKEKIKKIDALISKIETEREKTLVSESAKSSYTSTIQGLQSIQATCYQDLASLTLQDIEHSKKTPQQCDYKPITDYLRSSFDACFKSKYVSEKYFFDSAIIEKKIERTMRMRRLLLKTIATNPLYDQAHIELGDLYLDRLQFGKARYHYTVASQLKNPLGYLAIGFMSFLGYGCVPDIPKSQINLSTAADLFLKQAIIFKKKSQDKKLPKTERNLYEQKYLNLSNKIQLTGEYLKKAKMIDPSYLGTISLNNFKTDFIHLLAIAAQSNDSGSIALGRLFENLLNLESNKRKLLFNEMCTIIKEKPLYEDKEITADLRKKAHRWYLEPAQDGSIEAKYHLCNLYVRRMVLIEKDYERTLARAKEILQQIIEKTHETEENYFVAAAHFLYGRCLEKQGDQEGAQQWYQEAADFDPPVIVPDACVKVGQKYVSEGNHEQALKYFEKAEPYRPDIQEILSAARKEQGVKPPEFLL